MRKEKRGFKGSWVVSVLSWKSEIFLGISYLRAASASSVAAHRMLNQDRQYFCLSFGTEAIVSGREFGHQSNGIWPVCLEKW